MIYDMFEFTATIVDCAVLFWFLSFSLSFKDNTTKTFRILSTSISLIVMILNIFILNNHFTLEGAFTILYFIILMGFSMITLKGKWWHQFVLILVGLASIFLTNAIIIIISSIVLNKEYSQLLLMRNPARIFLLAISKLVLSSIIIPVAYLIKKKKVILHFSQSIIVIIALIVSIIAGIIIEKMILEHFMPVLYANIIMVSLAIINILLFCIFIQLSIHNQYLLNQVALQTRINDDEKKMKESIQWSKSVRALRHDLDNHLISIAQYIKDGNDKKALDYISKISQNVSDIPEHTETNNSAINAILDLKRITCLKEKINLKCYIQKDLICFDDVAFSTVFGNIMDNAIEAEKLESEKEIRLSLESKGEYLHITIQNRISHPVLVEGVLPDTKKKDKQNHGLGMYSITETIFKNNGVINIYEESGWFIVDVLMLSKMPS